MQYSIYFTLVIISFLASLTAYFQKNTPRYLRLFPLFLLVTIIVEVVSTWMTLHNRSALLLYNFFGTFEFLFYIYVVRENIRSRRVKKLLLYTTWLFVLIVVINFLFIQRTAGFNSFTYALGCLLIAVICIYYFFELFQSTTSVNLTRQPAFWICAGLIFFYACSFPVYALLNFLKEAPDIIKKNFGVILLLLNVLLYSSFTIAFLCRLRVRNSTS
ncbi:MAG TPA: hypothetical protein VHC96_13325 [Puia sp.]|jgi:hypothetical protein|nr:hypothetical protein [Puia sp.]